ncbi:MAG: KpsF/GutQ family sugar-phosphate isomerase [Thermodesulfobacteriota bacterium]|nr:KpsF/GutQ family sugar-phosphate isomerase [Thermodesulfobacteriota bacterium]
MNTKELIRMARQVITTEIEGLDGLAGQIGDPFATAVERLANIRGKVILTGIGKSGIIARKIASTMLSLGTPAIFMHPVDGLHGDLGAIMANDICIILSNSGKTKEIIDLLPSIKATGIPLIAITGDPSSPLGIQADITLECRVKKEACPLDLAPTASTTAQLALGDALAVVVSQVKGFDRDDFKNLHPAGQLGQQLMARISEVMITGDRIPFIKNNAPFKEIISEMTGKALGFTLVGDRDKVEGIITDGDLRRALIKDTPNIGQLRACDLMTGQPRSIRKDKLAMDALEEMEAHQITSLCVINDTSRICGVVHLHDLLGRGSLEFKETRGGG